MGGGEECLKAGDVWFTAEHFLSEFNSMCRFDIAIIPRQVGDQVGAGSVMQNSDGKLVLAAATVFRSGFVVDVAETLAILDGWRLATARGLIPLLVESDALSVVNLCLDISSSKLEIMNVIHDIYLLWSNFPSCYIVLVPRSCNSAAYEVVKFALLASISVV
ncbi:hypothetical protein ACOSQ2_003687 [Xanthoceras sorbifolium]